MRTAMASCVVAILVACGATAGVPSVTVEVDGVEIECRAETGSLDPDKCGEWGSLMIPAAPEVARIVITRHPGPNGPCEVDAFDANGDVIASNPDLPCRPLTPEH